VDIAFGVIGFVFVAWRLWIAIDRAEHPAERSYPQRGTAPGALAAPGRDHPGYNTGEWEREQAEYGIGRDSAQSIYARLRQQEEENETRLAVLIQGEGGNAWQRDPDPVAVMADHKKQATQPGYTIPKHDPVTWSRESNQRGKDAENEYCRKNNIPEVWQ
jgi:hypothetical protein